jgi:hypothetical protein
MATKHPDLFAALAAPFEAQEVKVRSQSGRQLHYITARVAMNRLDSVLGPENWWDSYVPGENSVLCMLTIRLPDGSTLTKGDAGGYAGMADSGDDDKSGYSDAFKRAAVKFGVARYLYRDGVPNFLQERTSLRMDPEPTGSVNGTAQAGGTRSQGEAAGRREERNGQPQAGHASGGNGGAGNGQGSPPRSGKALFAWTKDMEVKHEVGLLKYLNQWAKLQDFPGRMIDWDNEQVTLAYKEASRKLQTVQHDAGDSYEEALAN